jgi:hypothetical protein
MSGHCTCWKMIVFWDTVPRILVVIYKSFVNYQTIRCHVKNCNNLRITAVKTSNVTVHLLIALRPTLWLTCLWTRRILYKSRIIMNALFRMGQKLANSGHNCDKLERSSYSSSVTCRRKWQFLCRYSWRDLSIPLKVLLVEALCYKLEGRRFKSRIRWIFSILPTALWPWGRLSL